MEWRKGSRSNGTGGSNCVEVSIPEQGDVYVRNSRFPDGAAVGFTRDEWRAFVESVKLGEFDL